MKKINDILKTHVKHNAAHVIGREELKCLQDQIEIFVSIKEQLAQLPETREDLKEHLATITEIKGNLDGITNSIDSLNTKVSLFQREIITDTSEALYFST